MAFLVVAQALQATPLAAASLQQALVAVALSAEQQEPDLVQVQLEKVREATVARRRVMVFMSGIWFMGWAGIGCDTGHGGIFLGIWRMATVFLEVRRLP